MVKEKHSPKALSPRDIILGGSITLTREVNRLNTCFPRNVKLVGSVILTREEHPLKTPSPRYVTLDGIVKLMEEHSLNIPLQRDVTL